MIGRVPVLGEDHVRKPAGEAVDDRDHFIAARNRKGTTWAEIVLNIDHKQNVTFVGYHTAHLVTKVA